MQEEVNKLIEEEKAGAKRNELGQFIDGQGNPAGRPPDTEADKIKKKATKQLVAEYIEKLGEALPDLSPVLIKEARKGDVSAIKELHDRVMGKPTQQSNINMKSEELSQIAIAITKLAQNE